MKRREFAFDPLARRDIKDAWRLVHRRDGSGRADGVVARIEAFCRSLGEFSDIGTRHDDFRSGLRSTGVHGLKTAAVYFVVAGDKVTVVGVSYLGREVWTRVSRQETDDE